MEREPGRLAEVDAGAQVLMKKRYRVKAGDELAWFGDGLSDVSLS